MESPQMSSTVNMVAAGFGVTLVPESICHIHAPGVSYHNLCEPAFSSDIALVFRPRERSAVVQNFVHGVQNS
jgi:DNA-binding transcriptional LysR family regulator